VKIYMLLIDEERFFFFADESEPKGEDGDDAASSVPPRSGARKWVHDRIAKFKAAWQDAGSGALYWMRRAWDWLHTLVRPDEPMLARLRSARRIKLHHPAAQREVDVLAKWRNYLTRQWRRHFFWLGFNAVIAPISVILAVLPGPNLIGYWFAYRAVHHMIVVWGITRAQRNLIPTELHSVKSLDRPVEQDGEGKARHVALEGVGEQLDQHVAWWRGPLLGIPRVHRAPDRTIADPPADFPNRPEEPETGDHAPSEL
jgi:Mitochondrial K+-H+ exchange-related